ncbi:uncharacterized protein LOC104857662 [Fukomys damarensis]|uniref:uncharacterized protein LOC104857662 n=1 Tax=Fukomys damarensis TaxID=885580 RepID=UPI00053FCC36|nr:uncharacterized protein LOC104857662 [Fukomys damarensis]XP_010616020.1 uncharacterized protein LOC104857662 [Fukomys damarensis]
MTLDTCCFPGVKQHICALIAFLSSSVAWVLGITLVSSISWRVWELDSQVVPLAFIGLWNARYYVRRNNSGTVVDMPVQTSIHSGWTQATELQYAKDLMVLVNFTQPAALILSTVAFLVSRLEPTYPEFLRLYYRSSALLLFLSSGCVALAVSWNYAMDMYGHSTLDFPGEFAVDKEAVTKKHFSYVFPLGIVTATLSLLSGILSFGVLSFTQPKDQVRKAEGRELGCVARPEHRVLEEIATSLAC